MHDVVELEGVVRLREALQVQRVVLMADDGDADDHVSCQGGGAICGWRRRPADGGRRRVVPAEFARRRVDDGGRGSEVGSWAAGPRTRTNLPARTNLDATPQFTQAIFFTQILSFLILKY